jgi:hypothetical protein
VFAVVIGVFASVPTVVRFRMNRSPAADVAAVLPMWKPRTLQRTVAATMPT